MHCVDRFHPQLAGAIIAPFLLIGVFAMTQRSTAIGATDATLFFIFTVQPGAPVRVVPYDLMLAAIAMILGVVGAWIAYRFVIPINPARRLNSLLNTIMGDLHHLASGKEDHWGVVPGRLVQKDIHVYFGYTPGKNKILSFNTSQLPHYRTKRPLVLP